MWACSLCVCAFVYLFGPIFFHFMFLFIPTVFLLFLLLSYLAIVGTDVRIYTFHWKMNDEFRNRRSWRSTCNYFLCAVHFFHVCLGAWVCAIALCIKLSFTSAYCLMALFWYYSYLAHKLIHWHIAIFTCELIHWCVWNAVGSTELNRIPTTKKCTHTHTHTLTQTHANKGMQTFGIVWMRNVCVKNRRRLR